VLALVWIVAPAEGHEATPRIAEPQTGTLIPTRAEARDAEAAARQAEARAREAEARAREAAEAALGAESRARRAAEDRIAELEAELRRRG
jgi:hypothetical protein